jgi:hypothetical protein
MLNMIEKDTTQTVSYIAQELGETERKPISTIQRIVDRYGEDFALELLEETRKVEDQGGLIIHEGTRRRTPGGVFFYLIRGRISEEEVKEFFYEPPFSWKDRLKDLPILREYRGEARVKIMLIGRPGKVVEKRDFAITMIRDSGSPTLPKGLPRPPERPTSYMVYISKRQWKRVKDSILKHPDDVLIIEGFTRYDPELEGMAVFAMNTMTKFIQQQRRIQSQQQQALALARRQTSELAPQPQDTTPSNT